MWIYLKVNQRIKLGLQALNTIIIVIDMQLCWWRRQSDKSRLFLQLGRKMTGKLGSVNKI